MKEVRQKKEFFNKKARHDYEISDTLEAGIVLTGSEIKVIRQGRIDISTSYVKILNAELFWLGASFNMELGDRQRTKKLLVHQSELKHLLGKTQEKGMTIIPLKLYIKRGKAKLEIGLGKGLKKYDVREKLKKRDQERDIAERIKRA